MRTQYIDIARSPTVSCDWATQDSSGGGFLHRQAAMQFNPEERNHFEWIVERRYSIHRLMFDLYDILGQKCGIIENEPLCGSCFGLLTGAAFSLWRAAFLADTRREWTGDDGILHHAKKLLEFLVRDNAVAFPQDRQTRTWMVGYYLNNARYRIRLLYEKLQKAGLLSADCNIDGLDFEQVHNTSLKRNAPQQLWDETFAAVLEGYRIFARHVNSPR